MNMGNPAKSPVDDALEPSEKQVQPAKDKETWS